LQGTARIETATPDADEAWSRSTPFARRCYMATQPPGTPLDGPASGLPPEIEGLQPSEDQLIPARAHFALLVAEISEIDWLHLANTGHRRARFSHTGKIWHGKWIAP